MQGTRRHLVLNMPHLVWPANIALPTRRFRLLLVGDRLGEDSNSVLQFADQAYEHGMALCCTWGIGCELVHDLVDRALRGKYVPTDARVVMTTWHAKESLKKAAWYFSWALPSPAFAEDSEFWLAVCIDKPRDAKGLDRYLATANLGSDE